MYKISRNTLDLGRHLMNSRTGDLFEINELGRELLSSIKRGDLITEGETFDLMKAEGLIVDPSEQKSNEKFLLQLHLLNSCNLQCRHCYDWKDPVQSLTYEQQLMVIDNFSAFLMKMEMDGEISFTGGEPLLYKKLADLLDYTKDQDVFIKPYILTNGTVTPGDDLLKCFVRHQAGIQISIDGNEKIHDEIRGPGNYQKSIQGIKNYLASGLEVSVHYVIMRRNIDAIPEFVQAMEDLGIKRVNFSRLTPIGPGSQEEMLNPTENRDIIKSIASLQKGRAVNLMSTRPLWYSVGSSGFCPVGYNTITIDPAGKFTPCRRLPIILGDARYDSFFKAWFGSEFLQKMRKREDCVEVCGTCQHANVCGGCRAIANAVSGNPFSADPGCWIC